MYDITWPRAFNHEALAAVLASATRQHVGYVNTPPGMAAKVLQRQGNPDWYVHHLVEMAAMFRAGAGANVSSAVEDLTGRPPRSIESFATEHASSFSKDDASPLAHSAARIAVGIVGLLRN